MLHKDLANCDHTRSRLPGAHNLLLCLLKRSDSFILVLTLCLFRIRYKRLNEDGTDEGGIPALRFSDRPVALEGFQWSYYWRELQRRVVEVED